MSDWKDRVHEELRQLKLRRSTLALFIETEAYGDLSETAQKLLGIQLRIMDAYTETLVLRLEIALKEESGDA